MRKKRAFEVKQKTFFIIFKGLLVTKNCIRPESAPLILNYPESAPLNKSKIIDVEKKHENVITCLWEFVKKIKDAVPFICQLRGMKNI